MKFSPCCRAERRDLKGSVDKTCYRFIRQRLFSILLRTQDVVERFQVVAISLNPIFNDRGRQSLE
jgi:hypothetical protein